MHAYEREQRLALEIAERAAELARAMLADGRGTAWSKPDDAGQVTEIDLALERHVVAALRQAFPDDAILAEESADARVLARGGRCWMIDPVDGTSELAAGGNEWGIHIGLVVDGVARVGVVVEPALARTSMGVFVGGGAADTRAWLSHRDDPRGWIPLRCGGPTEAPLRLVTSWRDERGIAALLDRLGLAGVEHRAVGSTGVKACMVARGAADVYAHLNARTKLWDSAAPAAIVLAAGAHISDLQGIPLDYTSRLSHDRGLLICRPDLVSTLVELAASVPVVEAVARARAVP